MCIFDYYLYKLESGDDLQRDEEISFPKNFLKVLSTFSSVFTMRHYAKIKYSVIKKKTIFSQFLIHFNEDTSHLKKNCIFIIAKSITRKL
jgi:hypothetical protein